MRKDIATLEIARHYTHLMDIQEFIPPLSEARTLLLIGRDLPVAHHVLDQRVGSGNEPFAQRLRFGWIIVGETCLGKVHRTQISVRTTFLFWITDVLQYLDHVKTGFMFLRSGTAKARQCSQEIKTTTRLASPLKTSSSFK